MTSIPFRHRSRSARALLAATASTLALAAMAPAVLTGGPSAAQAPPQPTLAGLRVLLTNDDSARGADSNFGTDGKGLYELRKALCAAGADVLTVAPWARSEERRVGKECEFRWTAILTSS